MEKFSTINHHIYADDMQLQKNSRIGDIQSTILNLELCVKEWCSSRRLKFNADKTEIIWIGSRVNLRILSQVDTSLQLESTIMKPVEKVRNLGVYMDNELNMSSHRQSCINMLLSFTSSTSTMLNTDTIFNAEIVCALILSWLDYCNSWLAGLQL